MKNSVTCATAAILAAVSLLLSGCNTAPQTSAEPAPSSGSTASSASAPMATAEPATTETRGPDGCKFLPAARAQAGTPNAVLVGVAGALAGSQYNGMVRLSEQPDGAVKLDIPGKVLFKTGNADIGTDFQSVLGRVGGSIREWCGVTVLVVGHTDSTGSAAGNQRLSERRAASVVHSLRTQGLDATRLVAEGRGQTQPIADNASEDGRAQNRRVEIFIRPPAM